MQCIIVLQWCIYYFLFSFLYQFMRLQLYHHQRLHWGGHHFKIVVLQLSRTYMIVVICIACCNYNLLIFLLNDTMWTLQAISLCTFWTIWVMFNQGRNWIKMTDIVKIFVQSGLLTHTLKSTRMHHVWVCLATAGYLDGVIVGFNYVVQFHFKRWRLGQPWRPGWLTPPCTLFGAWAKGSPISSIRAALITNIMEP